VGLLQRILVGVGSGNWSFDVPLCESIHGKVILKLVALFEMLTVGVLCLVLYVSRKGF